MSETVEVCEKCKFVFMDLRPGKCPVCKNETALYEFKVINRKRVLKKVGC